LNRLTVLLALVISTPGAAALAQDSTHLSPQFLACHQRAGDNPVQKSVCAQREAGAQDDRLNKAYRQVMGQLAQNPAAKTKLRDEERSWIKDRDYTCKVNGNTIDESCVVMKTAVRADELESRVRF